MHISFTAADGKRITVADPRREAGEDLSLPEERAPAAWIISQLQVAVPQDRTPAAFMVSQMHASLPEERRPAAGS